MLGERLLSLEAITVNGTVMCNKNTSGPLTHHYCSEVNSTTVCDPYFLQNEVRYIPGIPGVASGIMKGQNAVLYEANMCLNVKTQHCTLVLMSISINDKLPEQII